MNAWPINLAFIITSLVCNAGVDLGFSLEWWVVNTNACKVHVKKLSHAHLIKTTPHLILELPSI